MIARRAVCLVTGGLAAANLPLQPWRYLGEVASQLARRGHRVTVITDGAGRAGESELLPGVEIRRLRSAGNPSTHLNRQLLTAVAEAGPDVILWHLGLTSFLHQRPDGGGIAPVVGVFTSPLYRRGELARLGWRALLRDHRLSLIHLLGTATPRPVLRRGFANSGLRALVTQTQTTARRLAEMGLWRDRVTVIPPGVDHAWTEVPWERVRRLRESLGYRPEEVVVIYFGPPDPLRGLPALIRALPLARRESPALRLLILSRRRERELHSAQARIGRLLTESQVAGYARAVDGYLDRASLIDHVALADVVALPFELVPSDAPLSVLEAAALGKPVVTTRVACLPELVPDARGYLAEPADPASLARALAQAAQELADGRGPVDPGSRASSRSWEAMGEEWSQLVGSL